MKKKSVFLRSALMLLVLAMVGATLFAGNTTLARYRSEVTGITADATVAGWSILVSNQDIATPGAINVPLTLEIVEWTGAPSAPAGTGANANNSWQADPEANNFAPGTIAALSGLPDIQNASDVTAQIAITIDTAATFDVSVLCATHWNGLVAEAGALAAFTTALETAHGVANVISAPNIAANGGALTFTVNVAAGATLTFGTLNIGWEWAIGAATGCDDCTTAGIAAAAGVVTVPVATLAIEAVQVD